MERASSINAGQMIQRRLAPLKVTIGLLYQRLGTERGDRAVSIDRLLLENVISTLELVVDDLEGAVTPKREAGDDKKFGETRGAAAARPS